jgi:hypothetical protein
MMKKILFVFLMGLNSIAYAQWTLVGDNDAGQFYIDLTSIHQINQNKRVWVKTEYSSNSKMTLQENIRSTRSLQEFDCRERKYRRLSFHAYKQPNLIDSVFTSNTVQEWQYIPPNSVSDAELRLICIK